MTFIHERLCTIDNFRFAKSYEPRREKTGIFAYAKTKDADQLRGNCEADQRLYFRYINSTNGCDFTARFVSGLVGIPDDRFSQNEAHKEKRGNLEMLKKSEKVAADLAPRL